MKNYIIILLSTILFTACSKDNIRGEGPLRTEDRTLAIQNGLDAIRINGSTDVEIIHGLNYKLEVSGYGNLLNVLSTEVKNKVLTVEFTNNYNIRNNNTKIILTTPYLTDLYINGSAEAILSGIFAAQESIEFNINGSGEIDAQEVNMNADFARYIISGSGKIASYNIISKSFEGNISGSGTMQISVFNTLNANISGSGSIYYQGNPVVNAKISGSGKVIKATN